MDIILPQAKSRCNALEFSESHDHQCFQMDLNQMPSLVQVRDHFKRKRISEKGLTAERTRRFVARCKPFVQAG